MTSLRTLAVVEASLLVSLDKQLDVDEVAVLDGAQLGGGAHQVAAQRQGCQEEQHGKGLPE